MSNLGQGGPAGTNNAGKEDYLDKGRYRSNAFRSHVPSLRFSSSPRRD